MNKDEEYFKRFNDLFPGKTYSDKHIHSTCTDGHATLEQIVSFAQNQGLDHIAVTDHVRKESTYCKTYVREISRLRDTYGFNVLIGFEAKVIDEKGNLDISGSCGDSADMIIGSVHAIPLPGGFVPPATLSREELEAAEYRLGYSIISSGNANVLGHAGGMSLSLHGSFHSDLMESLIQSCADSNVAFELNYRYHRRQLGWMLKTLKKYNPRVSLGSDAHKLRSIGSCNSIFPDYQSDRMHGNPALGILSDE